eukprot:6193237-Pleurochrysis_carterae.AAC.3
MPMLRVALPEKLAGAAAQAQAKGKSSKDGSEAGAQMNGAGAAAAEQGERATAQPGAGSPGSEPRSGTNAAGGSSMADGPRVCVAMLVGTGGQAPNRRKRCSCGRTGEREQEHQDAREWAELRAAVGGGTAGNCRGAARRGVMPLREEVADLKRAAKEAAEAHAADIARKKAAVARQADKARKEGEQRAALDDSERFEQRNAELSTAREEAAAQKAAAAAAKQSAAALKQRVREQQQRLHEAAATEAALRQQLERMQAEVVAEARAAVHDKLHSIEASAGMLQTKRASDNAKRKEELGSSLRKLQEQLEAERAQRGVHTKENGCASCATRCGAWRLPLLAWRRASALAAPPPLAKEQLRFIRCGWAAARPARIIRARTKWCAVSSKSEACHLRRRPRRMRSCWRCTCARRRTPTCSSTR